MAVSDIKLRLLLSKNVHVTFSHFRSLSIRKSACVNVSWLVSENRSTREPKYVPDAHIIYPPPYWKTN